MNLKRREREWEDFWNHWNPEQREWSVKVARTSRNLKLTLSSGVSIWNIVFGGMTWHSTGFPTLAMWCLGCGVAGYTWESGWTAHDYVTWARNKI